MTAYVVAERTREVGVRVALGAECVAISGWCSARDSDQRISGMTRVEIGSMKTSGYMTAAKYQPGMVRNAFRGASIESMNSRAVVLHAGVRLGSGRSGHRNEERDGREHGWPGRRCRGEAHATLGLNDIGS